MILPVGRPSRRTIALMNRLADEMAEGCPSVNEAGRRLGITNGRAQQLWSDLRKKLGDQAR